MLLVSLWHLGHVQRGKLLDKADPFDIRENHEQHFF